MDAFTAVTLGRQLLTVVILISAPLLGVGLILGLIVALGQAVTSLQDQTLSIVPKVLGTVGALFVLLPWILSQLVDFSVRLLSQLAVLGAPS